MNATPNHQQPGWEKTVERCILLFIAAMAVLLLVLLVKTVNADEPESPAKGETYVVDQRMLCALKEEVILKFALAVSEKDLAKLQDMIKDGKVGGLPVGTSIRIVDIRPRAEDCPVGYVTCDALRRDGTVQQQVYVFQKYFEAKVKHLHKAIP